MVVVSLIEFIAVGSPEGFAVALAPLIATYTVGRRLEWRLSWVALPLSVVVWVAWAFLDPTANDPVRAVVVVGLAGSVDRGVAAGRARPGQPAEHRAASTHREQQAVADERTGSRASCMT